ncbi:helix-turn-helix transcriptional regulator [Photobacterium damselae]|uniref:AraC family transcriptional regulator n=1 Tax=Photobacterium damselae TaxID=38293 RepID=A0ABD6X7M4_PHODM|nr:helix-turn-helix transcriptional regulator [Photobacterium damselae]MCG3812212.1 helix-turn-helix transcriptional regulator [Photobacterium damselae]OBU43863.1 hypothetical protein AYY27_04530 [Photobacterium damselae]PSU18754.1 AraC family transcriptional regulator [Photobacterium damselae]UKA12077.1 helix-turn-helix transcriptional regulator [Photobacterium damselae subsp. damselae]
MKCKIIIKPSTDLSPAVIANDYYFFSINEVDKQESISITSNLENMIILILSDGNIIHNGRSFSKLAIAPIGNDCVLDIDVFSRTYVICYDLKEAIHQEICSGLYQFISPYNYIVEQLIQDLDESDEITIMALKHLALLSLTQKKAVSDFNKIKQFIFSNIMNPELSLDLISAKLFMSRRKIQYILSRNSTSYGYLIDDIRFQILSNKEFSDLSIKQILDKAGLTNIATANRIFLKKVGMTMREYLSNEKE